MKTSEELIATLACSDMFHDYEHAFVAATGMPLALRPVATWQLPFRNRVGKNPFCALMAEQSGTCAACLQLQEPLTQEARHAPATRTCAYGLCEAAVPVKLGSQTIGYLQTGQVLRQPPTEAAFQSAVAQAARRGVVLDQAPARQSYFQTPVVSPKKLKAVTGLLTVFADHLAMKSNALAVQSAHTELPIIAEAKRFIGAHCTEILSLDQVSSSVNLSRFYFCKQFRKATGLSFTEFVSRTRVEKAKQLLLNPNLRISEIAFAVGFQSISHFNRMFKRIVGHAPTYDRRPQVT